MIEGLVGHTPRNSLHSGQEQGQHQWPTRHAVVLCMKVGQPSIGRICLADTCCEQKQGHTNKTKQNKTKSGKM
jgi:hypothetical protein